MEETFAALPMNENTVIHDPRNHPADAVESLRRTLAAGNPAHPDANRSGFYEIVDGNRVFYIHLSPATGRVTLLAIWAGDQTAKPAQPPAETQSFVPSAHSCPGTDALSSSF